MEGKMLMLCLLVASLGLALSVPFQPNYDNIPKCMQPAESGLCLAYYPSFYYNPSTGTCETFIYGGCRGNRNRFPTFDACMAECGGFEAESNESFKLVTESDEKRSGESEENQVQSEENICSLPSQMGPCRAMMPRFYFNGNSCESFIFGGCQGNENNFRSLEDCQKRCGSNSSLEEEASSASQSEENSQQSEESDSKSQE